MYSVGMMKRIARVSVISTGTVRIRPQHVETNGTPLLWWLNTGRQVLPSVPASSFFALGSGGNMIWVDPEHDMVIVTRWLEFGALDGFAKRVIEAVKQ